MGKFPGESCECLVGLLDLTKRANSYRHYFHIRKEIGSDQSPSLDQNLYAMLD